MGFDLLEMEQAIDINSKANVDEVKSDLAIKRCGASSKMSCFFLNTFHLPLFWCLMCLKEMRFKNCCLIIMLCDTHSIEERKFNKGNQKICSISVPKL